jgi:hypothetical protein
MNLRNRIRHALSMIDHQNYTVARRALCEALDLLPSSDNDKPRPNDARWEPIETAPLNGSWIRLGVWGREGFFSGKGYYSVEDADWWCPIAYYGPPLVWMKLENDN